MAIVELMMDRALEAVVRQINKLDRNHDIPYLAGYSKNAKTIYIDRHMPKSFVVRSRTTAVRIHDPPLHSAAAILLSRAVSDHCRHRW